MVGYWIPKNSTNSEIVIKLSVLLCYVMGQISMSFYRMFLTDNFSFYDLLNLIE